MKLQDFKNDLIMSFVIKLQENIMTDNFLGDFDLDSQKVQIRRRNSDIPRLVKNPNSQEIHYMWVSEDAEAEDLIFDNEESARRFIITLDEFKNLCGDEFTKKRLEFYFIPA